MEKFIHKHFFTSAGRNKIIDALGWFAIVGGTIVSITVLIAVYLRDYA
jgi:hypothetical protein